MKALKIFFGVVAVCVLVACVPAKHPTMYPIMLHYEGGEIGYKAARHASEEWYNACNKTIVVSRTYAAGSLPLREVSSIREALDPSAPAWVRATTGINQEGDVLFVMFQKDLSEEDATILLAHEFGHVLGIKDHSKVGLMTKVPTDRPQDWVVTTRECEMLL